MSKGKRKKARPAPPVTGRDCAITLRAELVENPDWEPSKDGEPGFDRFESRAKNIKESAIETLYARRFLASSQKMAADRFRELWESAGGKTSSIDYTLDRVDGGKADPVAGRIRAAQELMRVRSLIGSRGYEVLEKVCGEGLALAELTPHKRTRLTMADNLRADLDDAATMWGMQTRRRSVA